MIRKKVMGCLAFLAPIFLVKDTFQKNNENRFTINLEYNEHFYEPRFNTNRSSDNKDNKVEDTVKTKQNLKK
jgi:hypothetical protein